MLEYYPGLLFLTTNRVGVLDEAVRSRIHVSLYYPSNGNTGTVKIWQSNTANSQQISETSEHFENYMFAIHSGNDLFTQRRFGTSNDARQSTAASTRRNSRLDSPSDSDDKPSEVTALPQDPARSDYYIPPGLMPIIQATPLQQSGHGPPSQTSASFSFSSQQTAPLSWPQQM